LLREALRRFAVDVDRRWRVNPERSAPEISARAEHNRVDLFARGKHVLTSAPRIA
jgi:hypothetical protein